MQATGLASVPEGPRQAAAAPAATHQQTPQPFAFVPMGAGNNDSPQLHVPPPVNLESQHHMTHPLSQHAELQVVQPEYNQPEYPQPGPAQTAQGQARPSQQQQLQPQLQRQPSQLQPPREGTPASAASQLQPTWQDQPQYQFVNQSTQQLPRQLRREQLEQQHHLSSIPVSASVSKHPTQAQYGYAQLPQASQFVPPQRNQGPFPVVPAAVITSGAMAMGAPNMWSRAEGRSGSPAVQPQARFIQGPLGLSD